MLYRVQKCTLLFLHRRLKSFHKQTIRFHTDDIGVEDVDLLACYLLIQQLISTVMTIRNHDFVCFSRKEHFGVFGIQSNATVRSQDFERSVGMLHQVTSDCFHELLLRSLPCFCVGDTFGDFSREQLRVLTDLFEPLSEVLDNIETITVAVETSGFAVKDDSTDIGIVFEYFTECRFPFVAITVSPQTDWRVQRIAYGLGIIVKCFLAVVRILSFQEVKRKAEAERAVILINNVERAVDSIKFTDSSLVIYNSSFLS